MLCEREKKEKERNFYKRKESILYVGQNQCDLKAIIKFFANLKIEF